MWRLLLPHALILVTLAAVEVRAYGDGAVDFNRDVAPVLLRRCLECHNDRQLAGGLALTGRGRALAGGDSGAVIVPGDASGSLLIDRVTAGEMPPERKGKSQQLPPAEVDALAKWVTAGAPWPEDRVLDPFETTTDVRAGRDWWSLQQVRRPDVPQLASERDTANPIDAFILARLEKEGFTPAPPADRRTLIRRAYVDLLGLPPSYEEIEAFVAGDAPEAWERLVDRLLASPHYGERWGRYWLDLVRYADTCGYERDQEKPFAWKYRDWVVAALNDDMPYDRFILEQMAGDELPDRTEQSVIATGLLRLGTWNDEPNDPQDYKYERLEDLVDVTSSAFLGITAKCARCHDHKFDPIPQVDYYRLAAAFWAGPIEPRDNTLLGGPTAEELGQQEALAWTDLTPAPPPLHLLKNGDRQHPLEEVQPGPLSFVPALFESFAPPPADCRTSQRRWQLARWIATPENPLTARVMVNRLWQQHFGAGLVRSPNNFGFTGERPTHPELLDWLADEFVAGGWRLKPIHRLILTSRAYQQSSMHAQQNEYRNRDAANTLWWRSERRRLDAEALRDALLSVTGELDLQIGGPAFRPTISPEALEGLSRKDAAWTASPAEEQRRRSLYIFSQRSLLAPLMTTFDFVDTTLPCGRRETTTVAPQALALLNDVFTHERSTALAKRVGKSCDADEERIDLAWRLALGRRPSAEEVQLALRHVTSQRERFAPAAEKGEVDAALASLCHVLINTNEFVYVD